MLGERLRRCPTPTCRIKIPSSIRFLGSHTTCPTEPGMVYAGGLFNTEEGDPFDAAYRAFRQASPG